MNRGDSLPEATQEVLPAPFEFEGNRRAPALFPWNDQHSCFAGDFDSIDPFDHELRYEDTSQGDEIYFQQSGHMECVNCSHCESADGLDEGLDDF